MHILRVDDRPSSVLSEAEFDLFICASGYESRSTFIFELMANEGKFRSVLALGFEKSCQQEWRARNDELFARDGVEISLVLEDQEQSIFELLEKAVPVFSTVRLLVDYSSMPRRWINAIVNFFKFNQGLEHVEVFFVYSMGSHIERSVVPEYPESDYQISSIESLTTLEGAAVRQKRTMAIVGLGFEWIAPFAACELMEPDDVLAFYGEPGSLPDYGERALGINSRFIDEFCRDEAPIPLSVRSVEHTYRILGELAAPAISSRNVALVPLGPKTHVLACILVANRLPEVTCIYVQGSRERVQQVEAVGKESVVVTSVQWIAASGQAGDLVALD